MVDRLTEGRMSGMVIERYKCIEVRRYPITQDDPLTVVLSFVLGLGY